MKTHLALLYALMSWITNAVAQEIPDFVKSKHQQTLRAYLSANPHYYIAPESLCDCNDDLVWLRKQEPLFQPYYAVGDINDDGIEDFAVGLLDKRKSSDGKPRLTLVVFHGPFSKQKITEGIEVFKDYRITRSMEILSVFKSRVEYGFRFPARLDLGPSPFGSDDNWAILYDWKTKKYVIR